MVVGDRDKAMKVLVAGYGSAGQRHVSNLVKLDKIKSILIYTKVKNCLEGLGDGREKIKIIDSLSDIEVDFAIIANETHKHLDTAIFLAKNGIHLFIEKPLSHNLDRVNVLKEIVERKKLKVFVGYNLRFLGAMEHMKRLLTKGAIGDLYFAKIEAGQYLPQWRPNRDYRDSYSANRERGGGIALDLSHEIDYMRYLFGEPLSWKVVRTKVGRLEIDSDDTFEGIFQYENGFVCNVHLDYLQVNKRRAIRIVGSEGTIMCSFPQKDIRVIRIDEESLLNDESLFNINKTYMDELTHFIETIEKDMTPNITLEDGIQALRLIEDGNV